MPPKSKKNESKEKKKTIEDKTFGLKNKNKSAKVGKYVQQVEQQVMSATSRKARKAEDEKLAAAAKKLEEKKKQDEVANLFKPVIQQKVPFGVNPKTVLCEYFKAGACTKGDRCKFSHDSAVGRKGTKMDVYTDKRDVGDVEDTMDKWNEAKLEEVVLSKHGNPQTTTTIVCKYFLEAIETRKYGWFWECPNGGDKCKYKHALPPGFVLKKDKKKDSEVDEISLEEFLETERHRLGSNLTPVTLESFTKWKTERTTRKEADELKAKAAKEKAFKAGKLGNMSGRDYFEFNPEMYDGQEEGGANDGDDFDFAVYRNVDGGYQQDADYAEKAMSEMRIEDQDGGADGDAPVTNEALFAAEELSDDDDE
ncbi:Translation machinery-associated protein 46 [Coemansia sp. RSA 455]|nr:Translation machinery-associated protein 46 [Coemansia sp. S17]KAJ2018671.1 Translation machinery-associated protein 46 [Coemansia sp. S680]KAJ2032268.1 Translation machinery-associated protein 46 [Coemansia sp. S3946]KAJ2253844.1 Translation machinery-associated protein 46 [Coemansia sp. RSA 455]KAJ2466268.1 Translation machinery-associated protein 46 [Coemansia sp. RSA 2337]